MPIYDLHSHWGTEKMYPLRGKAQQAKQVDIWKTECRFVSEQEMADYLRRNDIRAMLDIGFTRELPLDEVKPLHDDMLAFGRTHPDIVLGNWLQVSPDTGQAGLDEIDRCRNASAGLTGLAVSALGNRRPITHPSFIPQYEYCIAHGMPVLFFVGFTGVGAGMRGGNGVLLDLSHPRYIDEVAVAWPDLEIIAARSAWPWESEMIAILLHKPNVMAEFHGMSPKRLPDETKREIRGRLKKKVMFANDYPLLQYEKVIGDWKAEGYSDEVLQGVFSGNAERWLERVRNAQGATGARATADQQERLHDQRGHAS